MLMAVQYRLHLYDSQLSLRRQHIHSSINRNTQNAIVLQANQKRTATNTEPRSNARVHRSVKQLVQSLVVVIAVVFAVVEPNSV